MTKRAISLAEFQELSNDMQLDILQVDGAHVGKRNFMGNKVILFQLYGFYVEVHYITYRKEVSHFITSDNSEILQPYLNQIQVQGLDKGLDTTT